MLIYFHTIVLILLLWAAWSDLRTRLIPNRIPALGLILFVPAVLAGAVPAPSAHLLVFASVFAVCLGLFAANLMGGGDAKLIPVIALWAGPEHIALFLLAMAIGGGLVALFMLVRARLSKREDTRPATPPPSVPYAVAIAFGGAAFTVQPVLNGFGAMLTVMTGNGV